MSSSNVFTPNTLIGIALYLVVVGALYGKQPIVDTDQVPQKTAASIKREIRFAKTEQVQQKKEPDDKFLVKKKK